MLRGVASPEPVAKDIGAKRQKRRADERTKITKQIVQKARVDCPRDVASPVVV